MFSIKSRRFYALKTTFLALFSISCFNSLNVPAEAATLQVPSTQYPTIQSAINAANLGDTIVVEAGRTYTEDLVLRHKASGTGWITIQSSALGSLPSAGNRVSPSYASNMPTIRSTAAGATRVIQTVSGATPSHHYKLIGLNIRRHNSTSQQTVLVQLGTTGSSQDTEVEMPSNIIIDRCIIAGADDAYTRRGVQMDVVDSQVINSYIYNFYENGYDSQAIAAWGGGKNILIANNFLEGASENLLIGGADPSIPNFVPTNWTIEYNHFFKNPDWRGDSPNKQVKYILEIKNAKDLIIQNNLFENNWAEAGDGRGIHFSNRNQDGTAPWSTVRNIIFRYNIVRNVGNGISFLVEDSDASSLPQDNIEVSNNLVMIDGDARGGLGWALLFVAGQVKGTRYNINHNTILHAEGGNRWIETDGVDFVEGVNINNNIVARQPSSDSTVGRIAANGLDGSDAMNYFVDLTWQMLGNVIRRTNSAMGTASTGNYFPSTFTAIGFVNPSQGSFELAATSPYKNKGTDGNDIGADIRGLNQRTACVQSGQQSNCGVGAEPIPARVTIKKQTVSGGLESTPVTEFPYTAENLSSPAFSLYSENQFVDSNVNAIGNLITVTEAAVLGWRLTGISCVEISGSGQPISQNTTVDLTNRRANIIVEEGEHVECVFTSEALAPTSADASVSGRITTREGRGVKGARVDLLNASRNEVRYAWTNTFGYYSFSGLPVGDLYIMSVPATRKGPRRTPSPQTFTLNGNITGMNFVVEY